jgi:hypothetical protein
MTFTSLHGHGFLFLVLVFMLPGICPAFQASSCTTRIGAVRTVLSPRSHSDTVSRRAFSSSSSTATTAKAVTTLFLFRNVLGHDASKVRLEEPITVYKNTTSGDSGTISNDLELDGLGDYVTQWANLFTNGGISLTTPVNVKVLPSSDTSRGVQLLFRDTNTGYKSHKEDAAAEKEADRGSDSSNDKNDKNNKKSTKGGKVKQGGVEIMVRKTIGDGGDSSSIMVVASRCEIDDETIIKEMSEERIMTELRRAIEVWIRETK